MYFVCRRVRRDALDEYYTYTYYGNPCSTSVYRMSQQLNKDQNDYLWMAIVGLSNHYLQQHIEHTEYTKLAQEYRREVSESSSTTSTRHLTNLLPGYD